MQTILRLPAVMARTGLKRSTIYERGRNNTFPRPIKLGQKASGWVEAEISAWVRDRISESRRDAADGAPGSATSTPDLAKPRREL